MSSAPSHPARRLPAWARRPSLAARLLGEALTPANDVVDETQTLRAADLLSHDARAPAADNDALLNEDPPFDPPEPDDDIFGAADGDEPEHQAPALEVGQEGAAPPDLFYAPGPAAPRRPRTVQEEVLAFAEDEARAAEPALDAALQAILEEVVGDPLAHAAAADDDEPPFDAPDASDAVLGPLFERTPEADAPHPSLPAPDALLFDYAEIDLSQEPAPAPPPEAKSSETPAPPIQIHASWDRPEIGRLLWDAAGDHRLARADMAIARGGIDGAAARFAGQPSPDLLIIDTTLRRAELLAALDSLALAIEADCKIIIIGTVNDIGLLRDLAARGVSEYIVPPFKPEDLARAVARLYAVQDQSRVIAVIGARGGVGASTIARNLAWSIAERQDACAALIDLDLAFGAAAFSLGKAGAQAMADALSAPDAVNDAMLARAAVQHTKHLQLLAGPAALERGAELEPEAVEALVRCARRANPYVVLDLPHAWTPWVKQALAGADEVVLVAAPDLASLRNAKSMVETLAPLRADKSPVLCALSMTGVPKRPEISAKDFTETVGVSPAASFAFEPLLFGQCETSNQMIGEADPLSKTAAALDALATVLTGRKPNPRKRAPDAAILARDVPADFAKSPKRGLRDSAPAPSENVLVLTRETSVGALAAAYEGDAESEYLAKARAATQSELDASQSERPRLRWGRISLAAAAAALALLSVAWRNFEAPLTPVAQAAAAPAPAPAPTAATRYASALLLIGERRQNEALPLLRMSAEAGHAPAQHRLAQLYAEADPNLARAWTERAAAGGHVRAMHDLGVYYAKDAGQAAETAAFRWFRQAAEFGVTDSQYNLGVLYAEGRGVSADPLEALFWFYLAAAGGDGEAQSAAQTLAAQAPPLAAEQARARALAFSPRTPNPDANL